MLETPHVIVGAAIAAKVVNPAVAIPLAFTSHFLLDMVPHWNPHILTELKRDGKISKKSKAVISGDVVLALIVGTAIAATALPNTTLFITIMLSSFAAVLPDLIEAPYFFTKYRSKFLESWLKFQKSIQVDADNWSGLVTQFAVSVVALWWLASGV